MEWSGYLFLLVLGWVAFLAAIATALAALVASTALAISLLLGLTTKIKMKEMQTNVSLAIIETCGCRTFSIRYRQNYLPITTSLLIMFLNN